MGSRLLVILPAGSKSTHTQLPLEVRPYASLWGSLWQLCLLFRQLLGLQRLGCSKRPTWCCLDPSKIKIIWRAVLELFCNCFPNGCNFVPLLAVVFFFGWGFHGDLHVRGMKKGWRSLLRCCCFSEKMLAQHFTGVSLGVLAEAPERRHYGTTVPQYLCPRLGCCT